MSNEKKSLTPHEALYELHKGLTVQVKNWEQQCLDLRKAELAKAQVHPDTGNGPGSMAPPPPPPAPVSKDELEMAECKGDAMCKCAKCEGMDRYAKGEVSMSKAGNPVVIARMAANKTKAKGNAPKPESTMPPLPTSGPVVKGELNKISLNPVIAARQIANKAKAKGSSPSPPPPQPVKKGEKGEKDALPPENGGKKLLTADQKEAGSDGTNVKPMAKAALPGAAPAAPGAAKPPGAGASAMPKLPKPPKLPGVSGGMPKPTAPAGGAKPPAMGAGTPALKTEMRKDLTWSPASKPTAAVKSPWESPPPAPKPTAIQSSAAAPPRLPGIGPGSMLKPNAPAPQLAGVGQPIAKPAQGVQSMVERVASRMTPPPAAARPAAALPGAHLFSKPGAIKPAGK